LGSDGSILLSGTAADGPIVIGGTAQSGSTAIAVARIAARCPIADAKRPVVTLVCAGACRRVAGAAIDDPIGRGVRRVLLGIERIAGGRCEAWNGRRFTALPCGRAAALVEARLLQGGFRTPPLGSGRFIVRAVAIDGAGNRSRIAVRRLSRV
jgi:hypothetical protein